MNLENQNLEWRLCEAYFSILEMSITPEVSIDQLVKKFKFLEKKYKNITKKFNRL